MVKLASRAKLRKRKLRVRKKVSGTAERPRLAVHKSGKHVYAQLVDDAGGRTLCYVSTLDPEIRKLREEKTTKELSRIVGTRIAELAASSGVESVVFDRGGHQYHGRIKEVAEGAREGGLKF